jgi:hypothetical protein
MEYRQYCDTATRAANLVESREYDETIALFCSLLTSDISDIDKALMCFNLALVQGGQTIRERRGRRRVSSLTTDQCPPDCKAFSA